MILIITYDESNKGYEVAIEILFEENYERVYRKALSILMDTDMAKDATQETLLKAFLKMDTLKDKSKFSSWVCAVVVNVCNRMITQKIIYRSRNTSIFDDDGNTKMDIDELKNFNIPEKIYEDKELRQELKQYIGELDKETQQIINMRFSSEFSIEEIAETLGIKEGTVKSRIHRAKQKIANKLLELSDMKGMKSNG
ncbi:MAG: RNA polymerase sigma factor [Clostridia bacterium]|nr:RNA polymerase sigma factor [Clostridia bacterium]